MEEKGSKEEKPVVPVVKKVTPKSEPLTKKVCGSEIDSIVLRNIYDVEWDEDSR